MEINSSFSSFLFYNQLSDCVIRSYQLGVYSIKYFLIKIPGVIFAESLPLLPIKTQEIVFFHWLNNYGLLSYCIVK